MIQPTDRVSTVLQRDEGLLDVFVAASPFFERLRNATLRRMMAGLVTVEQAARLAGLEPAALVARLNGQGDPSPSSAAGPSAEPAPGERPAALRAMAPERVKELDVREELRQGQEPFSRIMAARKALPEGGVLRLRAIFEPVPLYAVMARQGFDRWTERHAEDDWTVWFYPSSGMEAPTPAGPPVRETDDRLVLLDVRGLEPPEPMVRTLAALETLPEGKTLVQLNVRAPQFLLPKLEELGFEYEVREQEGGPVRVFIRRRVDA